MASPSSALDATLTRSPRRSMERAITRAKVASSSTSNRWGCSSPSNRTSSDMRAPWLRHGQSMQTVKARQTQLGERTALFVVIQFYGSTGTRHAGLAEEQAQTETLPLGSEERLAELLGDRQRHTSAMIANGHLDPLMVPAQADGQVFRRGISCIVQQIEQRLGQFGRRHQGRRRALADALVTIGRLGAHQVPALQCGF